MYCDQLDLVAPGVEIYSNYDGNIFQSNCPSDFTGTYYAASFVAGVVALVIDILPCATSEEVKTILCKTANKLKLSSYLFINDPSHPLGAWNSEVGYGLVDAFAAAKEAKRIKEAYQTNRVQNIIVTGTKLVVSKTDIRAGQNVDLIGTINPVIITSTGKVDFKAATSIKLEEGFHAQADCNFHARINPFDGIGCYTYAVTNKKTISTSSPSIPPKLFSTEFFNNIKPTFFPNPMEKQISIRYQTKETSSVTIQFINIVGRILEERHLEVEAGNYIETFANTFIDKIIIAQIKINNETTTQKIINNIIR